MSIEYFIGILSYISNHFLYSPSLIPTSNYFDVSNPQELRTFGMIVGLQLSINLRKALFCPLHGTGLDIFRQNSADIVKHQFSRGLSMAISLGTEVSML